LDKVASAARPRLERRAFSLCRRLLSSEYRSAKDTKAGAGLPSRTTLAGRQHPVFVLVREAQRELPGRGKTPSLWT
tara:strand:- start:274 stop:501 length:228 start_codon:yes stop_codon:yes gene_type:complete